MRRKARQAPLTLCTEQSATPLLSAGRYIFKCGNAINRYPCYTQQASCAKYQISSLYTFNRPLCKSTGIHYIQWASVPVTLADPQFLQPALKHIQTFIKANIHHNVHALLDAACLLGRHPFLGIGTYNNTQVWYISFWVFSIEVS